MKVFLYIKGMVILIIKLEYGGEKLYITNRIILLAENNYIKIVQILPENCRFLPD